MHGPLGRNGACLVIRIKFKGARDKSTDVGLRVSDESVIVSLSEGKLSVSHTVSSIMHQIKVSFSLKGPHSPKIHCASRSANLNFV